MGCTSDAVVCNDTGPAPDLRLLLLEAAAGVLLLVLVAAGFVLLLRRHRRRVRRPPVTRVWISASGDVVRRSP